jgi:hypothetical protein
MSLDWDYEESTLFQTLGAGGGFEGSGELGSEVLQAMLEDYNSDSDDSDFNPEEPDELAALDRDAEADQELQRMQDNGELADERNLSQEDDDEEDMLEAEEEDDRDGFSDDDDDDDDDDEDLEEHIPMIAAAVQPYLTSFQLILGPSWPCTSISKQTGSILSTQRGGR